MTSQKADQLESRLVETKDPELDRPVLRRPNFDGKIENLRDLDRTIGKSVREARDEERVTREDLARAIGLSAGVYARYERGVSKLRVTQLVQISDVLDFPAMQVLYDTAPYQWGATPDEARMTFELQRMILELPAEAKRSLVDVVRLLGQTSRRTDEEPPKNGG